MTTTHPQVEPTFDQHGALEKLVLGLAAVLGIGANAALALAVATFLYVLVTLL